MLGSEARVLYVGTDHCVTIYRNLMLMVVHQDPQPSLLQLLPGFVKRLQRHSPGPHGFIVVLPPDNPPPKEDARATIKGAFHVFSSSMSFGAFAVEKTGFTAAGQRSVLNMIMMAVRPPFPMKVFATVDEASRWIISKQPSDGPLVLSELVDTLEAVKAAYGAGELREVR